MPDEPELVLHVWPARWDLPTFTPACLASVLYLQLTVPGRFVVEESRNPDLSPDGQLPYLTHGFACIASFPSIVKYVEGLQRQRHTGTEEEDVDREDGEAHFPPPEARVKCAQETAWLAYVSANLDDLVACSLFTLRHNYYDFVRPALAELFPVPQRYYVPDRLRETYKPRLEAAGLWSVSVEEAEEEKRQKKGLGVSAAVQEAYGKAKVLETARMSLDILSRLLGDKPFFLDNSGPGVLDAFVAAHILLLIIPPFPNDTLRALVIGSYPSLLAHARRIQARTLSPAGCGLQGLASSLSSSFEVVEPHPHDADNDTYAPLIVRSEPQPSFSEVLSSLALPFSLRNTFSFRRGRAKSKADKEFDRMRWAWYGLALMGVVGWIWSTRLTIRSIDPEELERFERSEKAAPEEEAEEEVEEVRGDGDEEEEGEEEE